MGDRVPHRVRAGEHLGEGLAAADGLVGRGHRVDGALLEPDLVVEQTSPAGAVVSYPPPLASDDVDVLPRIECVPARLASETRVRTTLPAQSWI